jgi:hypothetical protein
MAPLKDMVRCQLNIWPVLKAATWGLLLLAFVQLCEIPVASTLYTQQIAIQLMERKNTTIVSSSLQVDNQVAHTGNNIDPHFSCIISFSRHGISQTSNQILLLESQVNGSNVWNSGIVMSNQLHLIEYAGLHSHQMQLISGLFMSWSLLIQNLHLPNLRQDCQACMLCMGSQDCYVLAGFLHQGNSELLFVTSTMPKLSNYLFLYLACF